MRLCRFIPLMLLMLLSLTGCSVGKLVCDLALKPTINLMSFNDSRKLAEDRYPGIVDWYDSLCTSGVFQDTVIVGETGVDIHAVYAGVEDADGIAIVIHGYGSNHIGMIHMARMYRDSLNFNVLLPDLQYHGSSGGVVRMGWYDRLDIKRWMAVANSIWDSDFMLVHGVSMGAATTMMVSGEPDLPQNVRCFIEDCGYTSVWDQYDNLRRERSHIRIGALNKASEYCEKTYGWNFKEASSLDQLARCDRPMLFIHGNPDNFVSVDFVYRCYAAKTHGYKEIWVEPNTPEHALMFMKHTDEYVSRVRHFIETVRAL